MRRVIFMMPFLLAVAGAQTMVEMGATTAGSAIGSAAGKKVSDGINSIFGKVDKTTANAAKAPEENVKEDSARSDPVLVVGQAAPKSARADSVPAPPPVVGRRAAVRPVEQPLPEIAPPPPPPPPPPPQVTAQDLRKVTNGMSREDLLKMGAPASRITMDDDGHLLEIFSYSDKDASIGRVGLTDGAVTSVEVH